MPMADIIKKPIITEKSLRDARDGVFTFEVAKDATKGQIIKAVGDIFKTHVKSVTTVIAKGKKRFSGQRRRLVYEPNTKRARVKLAAGEKIDLFEVGGGK